MSGPLPSANSHSLRLPISPEGRPGNEPGRRQIIDRPGVEFIPENGGGAGVRLKARRV
jgi:hypothetical protein